MDILSSHSANLDQSGLAIERQRGLMANAKNLKTKDEVKSAAEDFEAFFLSKMMETMFEGISPNSMFGGGHAEEIYRSMLINEYGKTMAKTGNVGVADYVMNSILEMQEMESKGFIDGNKTNVSKTDISKEV